MDFLVPESPVPGSATPIGRGVVYCYPPLEHGEAVVRAYYDAITRAIAAVDGRYVLVSDTRHVRTLPPRDIRKLYASLGVGISERFPGLCVCSITIVDRPVTRAVLAGILWFFGTSPNPQRVVASLEDALRIADEVCPR